MTGPILAGLLLLGVSAAPANCGSFTVTSYSAEQYPGVVADGSTTTWGALARGEGLVAVDPRVIPLGSSVWIEGFGEATARDTGGGVKGAHVDVLVADTATALEIGRSTRTVCVTPPGVDE